MCLAEQKKTVAKTNFARGNGSLLVRKSNNIIIVFVCVGGGGRMKIYYSFNFCTRIIVLTVHIEYAAVWRCALSGNSLTDHQVSDTGLLTQYWETTATAEENN